jgi:hypothetical protein
MRRPASVVVASVVLVVSAAAGVRGGAPQTSAPPLPDRDAVLRAVGDYLTRYEEDITAVVAEEDYTQQFVPPFVAGIGAGARVQRRAIDRRLKSDVLVLTDPSYGWVTFRDVFQVDGRAVRDHDQRLAKLFANPAADARAQAQAITAESARFNLDIPGVTANRTVNVPMAALLFFRRPFQSRSTFAVDRVETTAGRKAVVVTFVEQALPRIIRSPTNLAMRGSAWIEPDSGRVLRTSLAYTLTVPDHETTVGIDVTYTEDSRLKMWVPATMNEKYAAIVGGQLGGTLQGRAKYSRFRRFSIDVSQEPVANAPTSAKP